MATLVRHFLPGPAAQHTTEAARTKAYAAVTSSKLRAMGMSTSSRDRDILFGTVAVSRRILTPEELVEATVAWTAGEKHQHLADALQAQGKIDETQKAEIESIVASQSASNLEDTAAAALGTDVFGAMRDALARIHAAGAPPATTKTLETRSEAERFEIVTALARGGLGEVFVARDKQLNRDVALKQILERYVSDPSVHERFLVEAEITGRLEHPGVVPVYALGQDADGRYYYAMRLIKGRTLKDEIDDYFATSEPANSAEKQLRLQQLLRQFLDVCHTIDYAHSRGVIHRDLKPSNIMLGKYGETLVVDWGLAKQIESGTPPQRDAFAESLLVPESVSDSARTQLGSAVGTPSYMSPEQATGQAMLGAPSDIYGLGATFYHMLTGKYPHTGSSLDEVFTNIARHKFPPPAEIYPGVAKPLEAICLKAMELHPEDRYASAGEMARDIERFLADQPVSAYAEPWWNTAGRWLRRHQTGVLTSVVALVLLSVAGVAGSIVWRKVQLQQQQHAFELQQQEAQRAQEDEHRLAQRRESAAANLQFGLQQAVAGRFNTALGFFQQGEQDCVDEPRLDDLRAQLVQRRQQMARLAEFDRLYDEAMLAMALENDAQAMYLLQSGLGQFSVLRHADWWEHLPVQGLHARETDRLRRRVHLGLVVLGTLISKRSLTPELVARRTVGLPPPELSALEQQRLALFRRAVRRANAYRASQWMEHFSRSADFLYGEIASLPTPPDWRGDNFVDAFFVGAASWQLAQQGDSGFASALAGRMLGIDDPEHESARFLRRATAVEPTEYLPHISLGWLELSHGNFEAAVEQLQHARTLRPDLPLAYNLRSHAYVEWAKTIAAKDQQQDLIKLALSDSEVACRIVPDLEVAYWFRGNALRQFGQPQQAAASYLMALECEYPVSMLQLQKWQFLLQGRDPRRARHLGYLLPNRFDEAVAFAREMQNEYPENAQFTLLEATALLALGELDEAEASVEHALKLAASQRAPVKELLSQMHAVAGELSRERGEWKQAQPLYSQALQLDPSNAWAAEGLAATLEQLALEDAEPGADKLALGAYEHLAEIARAHWQSIRAQQGMFRLQLRQGQLEQASAALERLLQLDPGQDVEELRQAATDAGAAEIVQRLDALELGAQLAEPSGDDLPQSLPLGNADFELPLNQHWAPWTTTGDCFAEVLLVQQARPDADDRGCLALRHYSQPASGERGVLLQTVPAAAGRRYRLSAWGKSDGTSPAAVQLVINDQFDAPILTLPDGSYDWQQFSAEFALPASPDKRQTFVPTKLTISSTGPAKVWLDDIRIELLGD